MKVKELIELLQTLDPEKEIKTVVAFGWEYEEETNANIEVVPYESTKNVNPDGHVWYHAQDHSDNKDFYLLKAGE